MKSSYVKILKENQNFKKIKTIKKSIKIGISSNININFFDEIIENFFFKNNIKPKILFGTHNNFLQDSFRFKNNNITIIFWETINILNENISNLKNYNENKLKRVELNIKMQLKKIFHNLNNNDLVLFNKFSNVYIQKNNYKLKKLINNLNWFLTTQEVKIKNLKVIDYGKFLSKKHFDLKNYNFTKSIYKLDFFYTYLKNISKLLIIKNTFKKVLIVDCDHTLWKGILGEDGYKNLKMSKNDHEGYFYYLAQKEIVNLALSGVIVCICSKNNERDFVQLQKNRKDFLIKNKHIVIKKINWEDKYKNIYDISKILNLDLGSFVFLDDSEFEINLVKKYCKNVITFQVPKTISKYPALLKEIKKRFDTETATKEDKRKILYYKKNFEREKYSKNFHNIDDYLKQLKIKLILQKHSPSTVKRISQMTLKTNQFNLANSRYNESKIKEFLKRDDIEIFAFSVKDIFGDNGITVLLICKINKKEKKIFIDTFLMSCRVFGRKIEYKVLDFLIKRYQKKFKRIVSKIHLNGKNNQFKNFYKNNFFKTLKNNKNEIYYKYDLNLKKKSSSPNYIKLIH